MSYILDALERSEQERKQGEAPSFRQDQALLYLSNKKRFPWLAVVAGVLLLNVMVILYVHFSQAEQTEQLVQINKSTASASPIQNSPQTAERGESVEEPAAPLQEPLTPVVADTKAQSTVSGPEAELPLTQSQSVEATITQGVIDNLANETQDTAQVLPSVMESNESALSPSQPQVSTSPSQPELIVPSDSSGSSLKVRDTGLVEPKLVDDFGPRVVIADEPITLSPPVDPYIDTVYLHELSSSERPRVPKLIFNSHIYSSTPSARRVMINNIYLREGQAFEGMTLLSIGEEYIVFEKRGIQFKVAAMRDWLG